MTGQQRRENLIMQGRKEEKERVIQEVEAQFENSTEILGELYQGYEADDQ